MEALGVLLALAMLVAVPFVLAAVALNVLFTLVLLPFKLVLGLFKGLFGLVFGLVGGLFGLLAGGIGLVGGLLVLFLVLVLLPLAPLLLLPALARRMRAFIGRLVGSSSALLLVDPTEGHTYRLEWQAERVQFSLDEQIALESQAAPAGRLGLVLWVDNQFAAWEPFPGFVPPAKVR